MYDALDIVYENGGDLLLNDLVNSEVNYSYYEETGNESGYTKQKDDRNVEIYVNLKCGDDSFKAAIAHESMHAAQYENGQGGRYIYNEVEAYSFVTFHLLLI